MRWRDIAQDVIRNVVRRVGTEDKAALKKALFDAYPFGQRQYYPYRIWCEEVRKTLGKPKHDPITDQKEIQWPPK